jgi:hypothetical protein
MLGSVCPIWAMTKAGSSPSARSQEAKVRRRSCGFSPAGNGSQPPSSAIPWLARSTAAGARDGGRCCGCRGDPSRSGRRGRPARRTSCGPSARKARCEARWPISSIGMPRTTSPPSSRSTAAPSATSSSCRRADADARTRVAASCSSLIEPVVTRRPRFNTTRSSASSSTSESRWLDTSTVWPNQHLADRSRARSRSVARPVRRLALRPRSPGRSDRRGAVRIPGPVRGRIRGGARSSLAPKVD